MNITLPIYTLVKDFDYSILEKCPICGKTPKLYTKKESITDIPCFKIRCKKLFKHPHLEVVEDTEILYSDAILSCIDEWNASSKEIMDYIKSKKEGG